MNAIVSSVPDLPLTSAEERAVREQLERILSSPHFNHSKRYPAFLRYIVEEVVAGRREEIKERTIGSQVFGRPADYETSTDPIVRVTAGAIRRRLSQYYLEPGRTNEVHIDLPAGTYVPVFTFPEPLAALLSVPKPFLGKAAAVRGGVLRKMWDGTPRWFRYVAAAAAIVIVISSSFTYKEQAANNPVNQFWNPLVASNQTMLLCVANARENDFGENVSLPDMLTLSEVENTLKARKRAYQVVDISTVNPSKMGNGPAVFVTPYHNKWAIQLAQGLRYRFEVIENPAPVPGTPKQQGVIKDSLGQTEWRSGHSGNHDENYAIVARFFDTSLARTVVLISGVTPAATTAAGQLLTDAKYTDLLASRAPADWQKMNVEAVIRTEADNHQPGPPQIEAAYFWQ